METNAFQADDEQPSVSKNGFSRNRTLWIGIAFVLFFLIQRGLPLDGAVLESQQLKAPLISTGIAVLVMVAVLWMSEALPLAATALLIPLLGVFALGQTATVALAGFSDPFIYLFLSGFILAAALRHHALDAHLAHALIRLARGNFVASTVLLLCATFFISMWISNTATAAMMLPLGLGLIEQLQLADKDRRRAQVFILLGIAHTSSVAGVATLVGTPPNGVAARQLGISFQEWLKFGIPTALGLFAALLVLLFVFFKPSKSWKIQSESKQFEWNLPRLLTLLVFLVTVFGWLFSSQLKTWLGIAGSFETVVGLTGVALLFLLNLVPWKIAERSVEWSVLLLFGGGIALGNMLDQTGTSSYLAFQFAAITQGWSFVLLIMGLIFTVIVLSEFGSNTAVANLMVPIFAGVAVQMGMGQESLVIPVALAASCGFMLPVATPPNSLVYGTGKVTQREMIKFGIWFDLACVAVLTLLSLWFFK